MAALIAAFVAIPLAADRPASPSSPAHRPIVVAPMPEPPEPPVAETTPTLDDLPLGLVEADFPAMDDPPDPPIDVRLAQARLPQARAGSQPKPKAKGPVPKAPSPPPQARNEADPPPLPRPANPAGPKRVRVADRSGQVVVARVYGGEGSRVVLLPDGQLGWPNALVFVDEPFRPLTIADLREKLQAGELKDFPRVEQTDHYLVFSKASARFTEQSASLLESQYQAMLSALGRRGLDVREAEFPLVAVLFEDEAAFRARKRVAPEVQAYYEVVSNRIFFYERSERDQDAPEAAALRRPQTVSHEGAHQILGNIGVQPRLSPWPPWIVEGLAEYCAASGTKRHAQFPGIGKINPFHMATYGDLRDPATLQLLGEQGVAGQFGRDLGLSWTEDLVQRTKLNPTDYALSWALTSYLASKQMPGFLTYLRSLQKLPPEGTMTPADQLRLFREAFGPDAKGMRKSVDKYLLGLKDFEGMPYYAVRFEQAMPNGFIRRGTIVSQSPAMIRQWVQGMIDPNGGAGEWHAFPYQSRASATIACQQWLGAF